MVKKYENYYVRSILSFKLLGFTRLPIYNVWLNITMITSIRMNYLNMYKTLNFGAHYIFEAARTHTGKLQ